MQNQQDLDKAHCLSKPTLVEGLSRSTLGTTGPQKQGSSAYRLSLQPPQISQLNCPWSRREPHRTTVGRVVVPGAYKN